MSGEAARPVIPSCLLSCLKAPGAGDETTLVEREDGIFCPETGELYPLINGIPSLLQSFEGEKGDFTRKVRTFYEENSFPNYEGMESYGELVRKGRDNPFSAGLLRAVGYNKRVLECGCGTGQLTHFLQLNNNHVLGIDLSLPSLGLAVEHRNRNQLTRSAFAQMDLNNLAIKDESFDIVISNGVLVVNHDPEAAFAGILRKVKPGGIIMVGMYNWYARVSTWLRGRLIGLFGPRIDYVVRNRIRDPEKARVWIADQYYNPYEVWHSIDDVLKWFAKYDVTYLNCQAPILGTDGEQATDMFAKTSPGTLYQRVITQIGWIWSIGAEGSLFVMIGRKGGG